MFRRLLVLPPMAMILPTRRLYSNTPSSNGVLEVGKACRPKKPAAGGACGEDACLVTPLSSTLTVLAVADGVGGWRKRGVDPSLFSNQLMASLQSAVKSDCNRNPLDLLKKAFWQLVDLNHQGAVETPGSSTACVAVVDTDCNKMAVCNVGDSGLMVVRVDSDGNDQIIFKTTTQQTTFNAPLQLTLFPGAKGHVLDPTSQSENTTIAITSGDCIILATDGLFDNLFPEDITAVVKECRRGGAQRIADGLVNAAYRASVRTDTNTPFSVEAQRAGKFHVGGKPDDITVIVGII